VSLAPLGILGGTFNPVHYGHLRSALELMEHLQLGEVRLMPSAQPPHRPVPECPAAQRAAMVRLAVADEPGLVCDERELHRAGPSYTIDSLCELRQECGPERSLCLILGADAVAGLESWHRWQELLSYAHIVVIARPGWELPREGVVASWLQQHLTQALETLQREPQGSVFIESMRPLAISATEIRELVAAGKSARYLLPDVVWNHIQSVGLYADNGNNQE